VDEDEEAMAIRDAENGAGTDRLHSGRRVLAALETIAARPHGATPKDVSQALGLHLSTCYRLLNTLDAAGYIFRSPDNGMFHLGRRLAYLNHCYQVSLSPPPEVLAFLHALQRTTGETAMLVRLEGDDVVITAVVEGSRPGSLPARYAGMAGPAHAVAAGRCLLAWLPTAQREAYLARYESLVVPPAFPKVSPAVLRDDLAQIRETGYAFDRGESNPAVCCIAAPIRDDSGASGAVAIVAPCGRLRREEATTTAIVMEVARTISTLLSTLPEREGADTLETELVSREAIEAALATVAAAMSRVS
jgi:DNA-binding IclR family transcriptional regulator